MAIAGTFMAFELTAGGGESEEATITMNRNFPFGAKRKIKLVNNEQLLQSNTCICTIERNGD